MQDIFRQSVLFSASYKVQCLDHYKGLFVGDQTGNVYHYPSPPQGSKEKLLDYSGKPCQVSKQRIEAIAALPFCGHVIIQTDSQLWYINGKTFQIIEVLVPSNVQLFAMNASLSLSNKLLVVTKKKEAKICQINTLTLAAEKEVQTSFLFEEAPQTLLFVNETIFYGVANKDY